MDRFNRKIHRDARAPSDIWAPGVSILSTLNNGGTGYMSGTPMASPHVAGAGALYLSRNTTVSPATAREC